MSFDYNYKFWIATKKTLNDLLKRQNVLKNLRPISEPAVSFKMLSELYVLYVELVNKLAYIYLHTYQVQKREIVRPLVEAAVARLQELKNELKSLEFSEYVYVDKALIKKRLTPYDIAVWRSPQFLYRRPPDIQNIMYDHLIFPTETDKKQEALKEWTSRKEAITLIQAHERARAKRVYRAAVNYDRKLLKVHRPKETLYKFTHKAGQIMSIPVKRTAFKSDFVKSSPSCQALLDVENLDTHENEVIDWVEVAKARNDAAIKIQRAWRAYKSKKLYKYKAKFKLRLYGLEKKRKIVRPFKKKNDIMDMYKNEVLKQKLDADFVKLISDERTRLLQQRSPWIMEDISDHIRGWFQEFYEKIGNFHPYPEALKSGTVLVLIDETMTPLELQEKLKAKPQTKEEKQKEKEKQKAALKKQKEKLKKEKMKEAKRRKKMKERGIIDLAYDLKTSKHIAVMEETMKKYAVDWQLVDEYLNKTHEAIKEWVTEEELAKIHKELRELVDEYMRIEYELLKQALCADLKKKYKPPKAKKPKKPKKGKNKKKEKDITADRTIESLYDELKDAGLIHKFETKAFDDFIAEFNFTADDTRDENRLATIGPSKGDLKQVVQDCMLGMGEFGVDKPKSLCLIGSPNNGKRLLCNIIAAELDALVINISPEKTAQFSEDLKYFVHVVMKVAKAFQPTILYIEEAHRVFWKKIPPEAAHLQPRLLQSVLSKKMLKPIKKSDKIMLLGTSSMPWTAKKGFKKAFQKILLIPKSDYGSSFFTWLNVLFENADDNSVEDYVVSALAKVFQYYSTGDVTDNAAETLSIQRRMKLAQAPLQAEEFLEYFIQRKEPILPPDPKMVEKLEKWFQKSNKLEILKAKFKAAKEAKQKKK